jgi:hypothetical protein
MEMVRDYDRKGKFVLISSPLKNWFSECPGRKNESLLQLPAISISTAGNCPSSDYETGIFLGGFGLISSLFGKVICNIPSW